MSKVSGEIIFFPSLEPPELKIPKSLANPSALPCPFAEGISAHRHSGSFTPLKPAP